VDAAYRSIPSKRWEPVQLQQWRGDDQTSADASQELIDKKEEIIKKEVLPDGTTRWIVRNRETGEIKNVAARSD
jgi:hypothetical protein